MLAVALAYRNYGTSTTFLTLPAAEDISKQDFVVPRAVGNSGYMWALEYITKELVQEDILEPSILPICEDTGFIVLGTISNEPWLWTVYLSNTGQVGNIASAGAVSALDGSFASIGTACTMSLSADDGCSVLLAGAKTGLVSGGRALVLNINAETLTPQVGSVQNFGSGPIYSLSSQTIGSRVVVAWLDDSIETAAHGAAVVFSPTLLQVSALVDYGKGVEGVSLPAMVGIGDSPDNVQFLFSIVAGGGGAHLTSFKVPSSNLDPIVDNFPSGDYLLVGSEHASFAGGRAIAPGPSNTFLAVTRNADRMQFYTTWRLSPNSAIVVKTNPKSIGRSFTTPSILYSVFPVSKMTAGVAIDTGSPVAVLVRPGLTLAVQLEILTNLDVIPRMLNVRAGDDIRSMVMTASGMRIITISPSLSQKLTLMDAIDLTCVWQLVTRANRDLSATELLKLRLFVPLQIMHETSIQDEPGTPLLALPREVLNTERQVLCAQLQTDQQIYIQAAKI
jgi:hypothetical protein